MKENYVALLKEQLMYNYFSNHPLSLKELAHNLLEKYKEDQLEITEAYSIVNNEITSTNMTISL